MSKETEPDMLPEYDLAGGERGKYADRFEEDREGFLNAAAAMDRKAWLALSLQSVQQLEGNLVAYWSLALGEGPEAAGRTVSALLELFDAGALERLRRDLDEHTTVTDAFHEDLRELISDRSWLIHRSFHAPSAARLESISDRSKRLSDEILRLLLERCSSKGMDARDVAARTNEVVEEWASGRDAA